MERTSKRYTVNWCRYPHGIEGEAMVCHSREFCNLDTAKKFLRNRLHAIKSINWAGGWIEDEHCNWLYSIDDEGRLRYTRSHSQRSPRYWRKPWKKKTAPELALRKRQTKISQVHYITNEKVCQAKESRRSMPTKEELKQLQALPLDLKIARTQQRIREWVRHYGENGVYVSFSGGKDSTVLLHIVREMYPDIEAVFVNTGLEYPEIQAFVKTFPNVRILYPQKGFKQVLSEKGYPVINKEVSHAVSVAKRIPHGKYATEYFDGSKGMYDYSRYKPLIDMDFMIDNRCCNIMKKEPAHRYGKESGKVPFTAQMACESRLRKSNWLINGCNAFDVTNPISNPMSFWTEQDILMYIKAHNIKICSVYGEIVYDCDDPEQERFEDVTTLPLKTTGCSRTGCIYCAYGCHLERGETRFQRLAKTHPKLYAYCIKGGAHDPTDGLWKPTKEGLGLGYIFDRINEIYGENFIRYKPTKDSEDKS